MQGDITFGIFGYAFVDAMIQTDPNLPPAAGKILRLETPEGLTVLVPFSGAEQWEQFQQKVAEEKAPSRIQIVPGGAVPKMNGHVH